MLRVYSLQMILQNRSPLLLQQLFSHGCSNNILKLHNLTILQDSNMLIGLWFLKKTRYHQNAPVSQYFTHTLIWEAILQQLSLHYKLYENTYGYIVYLTPPPHKSFISLFTLSFTMPYLKLYTVKIINDPGYLQKEKVLLFTSSWK